MALVSDSIRKSTSAPVSLTTTPPLRVEPEETVREVANRLVMVAEAEVNVVTFAEAMLRFDSTRLVAVRLVTEADVAVRVVMEAEVEFS